MNILVFMHLKTDKILKSRGHLTGFSYAGFHNSPAQSTKEYKDAAECAANAQDRQQPLQLNVKANMEGLLK